MRRILDYLNGMASMRATRWLAGSAIALAVIGTVLSQSAPPAIPAVDLAAEPLYARGARAKPTLTLALSVEFPTVGAQYVAAPRAVVDDTYTSSEQYIGYFDSESCYAYNDAPAEARPGGVPVADYKRFDRVGAAASRTCGGTGFSGNVMNWASSSAIDILRYGLTGGDRVVDTDTLTVLQRAVLPNSSVSSNFWNGSNFPDKQLSAAEAVGAIPAAVLGSHTGTVHIANCLNRLHFGTRAEGSCDTPGANSSLGIAAASRVVVPRAAEFVYCADHGGVCNFAGNKQVIYGEDLDASGSPGGYTALTATNTIACDTATFGRPFPGGTKRCYYRDVPAAPTNLTTDSFYYARASVCGSSAGVLSDPRSDLCLRYPSGQYKPIGNLQKYSSRVRVAAFGYLNDSTGNPDQRYGGVLRAPMKYVGPTTYDAGFALVPGGNPRQEWDPVTGVFVANPDANTTVRSGPASTGPYLSGVTNYLNQFGRTGAFGQYKTYDPIGEMYYESLRYLQGLPPTPQATVGITDAMRDGFPVGTTWTDPHPSVAGMSDYSCVRNSIVAVGDVNTHNDKALPGNVTRLGNESAPSLGFPSGRPRNEAGNEPDFHSWTAVVGGFESGNSIGYLDGAGNARSTSNFNPANLARSGMETQDVNATGAAYYMVGAAYWANTHDIRGAGWTSNWPAAGDPRRSGMRVTTYVLDVNEHGEQSNESTRRNNQFFLAAKYGGFSDVTRTGTPFKLADLSNGNANWESAARPGEARNYFLSSSAGEVLAALNQIFSNIASQADSIAGGATSTQQLTSVASYLYRAQFDPAGWSGDLAAYSVSASASGVVGIDATPVWRASVELNAKAATTAASGVPGGDSRNIVVGKTVSNLAATATPFRWANLDIDAQDALRMLPYAATGTAADPVSTGQARLDYLRGDRANEAPSALLLRQRSSVLGDIVNSAVVFSGAPSRQVGDPAYATFYATHLTRKQALFVGANDGMLHAFDANNGSVTGHTGGDELFAYIPSWIVPRLGALTSPSYVHQSYVDGSSAVAEAKVGTTWASGSWKTVLVGSTGGGGQGVFALDVSDPAAFDASKVMWEFTDRDDADMGNVIGKPQILKLRTNSASATTPDYQYFAVVASGVNNYVDDGRYSSTGSPAIFLLDLSKQPADSWALNRNYFKVSFPVLTSIASGMIGFTARLSNADAVGALYAGDLQGNLWKLDFTQAAAGKADWNLNNLSFFKSTGGSPLPMYIAANGSGARQPISMEPSLVYGPNRSVIVTFGTGKFLEVADNLIAGAPQQSVYAILDDNSATPDSGSGSASAIAGRARLKAGAVDPSSGSVAVAPFTWGRSLIDTDPTGIRSGWYFDFGNPGERQVSGFSVLQGRLIFGSVIPAANSCDNGSGNLYVVDVAAGDGSSRQSTVGILGEPILALIANATSLTPSDSTGLRKQTTRHQIILQGSGGAAAPADLALPGKSDRGRLSWREIGNYQQLRNN